MIIILEPIKTKNMVSYPIIINGTTYNFFISYDIDIELNTNIDGIVAMLTSVAICNKWKIQSKLPIDIKLYQNLKYITNLYKKYHHKHTYLLSHISKEDIDLVLDMPTIERKNNSEINITPISMGIDSLHTVLSNDMINHLLYIDNFDLSYTIKTFKNNINEFADKYNKKVIYAKSNFKELLDSLEIPGTNFAVFTNDTMFYASVSPLNVGKIYLSGNGGDLPCVIGQHTEIGKYLESNNTQIILNNIQRISKLKYILEKDITLLNKLRVCNNILKKDNGIIYNCSECDKCTEVLVYLYMLDYLDKVVNFKKFKENYLEYYLSNFYDKPGKLLASVYYEKIFTNVLKVYYDGNIYNIDKYHFYFENDECIFYQI